VAEQSTVLATRDTQRELAPTSSMQKHAEMIQRYDILSKFADRYAKSKVIPQHFQQKPDDVFVVIDWADNHGIDFREALEQAYVISGKMGLSAKMLIALTNKSGLFKGPLRWEITGAGDGRTATCIGVDRATNRELRASCSYRMAKDEGWTRNKKWQSMTDVMLQYRSASIFQRMYCPQVTMMLSSEEIVDIGPDANLGITVVDAPPAEPSSEPTQPNLQPTNSTNAQKWKDYCAKPGVSVSMDELRLLVGWKQPDAWDDNDNATLREALQGCYQDNTFVREHFDHELAPRIDEVKQAIEQRATTMKVDDYKALLRRHGIDGSKGLEACHDATMLLAVLDDDGAAEPAAVSAGGDDIPF